MKSILFLTLFISSAYANTLKFSGETAHHLAIGVETCGAHAFPDGSDYSVETKDMVCSSKKLGRSSRFTCELKGFDENGNLISIKPHEIDANVLYDAMTEASLNKVCRSTSDCSVKARQMKCMISGIQSGDIVYQCQVEL